MDHRNISVISPIVSVTFACSALLAMGLVGIESITRFGQTRA
jgi:hypothetical protein